MSHPVGADVEVRTAARVVLVDPEQRVLLLGARDPADGRVVWFVPGGGVEAGEDLLRAARRELSEEVPAAADIELHGPVWRRHHDFSWAGHGVCQEEWFFVARLDQPLDAATIRLSGIEARSFVEARWATLADLADWPDILAPRRMAELLVPILAGQLPDDPIDAGV